MGAVLLGSKIDKYVIESLLGEGAMGEVYLAHHEVLEHKVAIKVLRQDVSKKPKQVQRFFLEARAVAKLRHPGLAQLHDFGHTADGRAYIVMEYFDGETLHTRLERLQVMAEMSLLRMAVNVAQTLAVVHEQRIVHRDLKPDNIFIVKDASVEGGERTKILDFGVAKLGSLSQEEADLTHATEVLGTPLYMAPEQWRGAARVDLRADVYSLGCIIYRGLCGRPPFIGDTLAQICAGHLVESAKPLTAYPNSVSDSVNALVMRCLEKAPEKRPSSMAVLAREIKSLLVDLELAPPSKFDSKATTPMARPVAAELAAATSTSRLRRRQRNTQPIEEEPTQEQPTPRQPTPRQPTQEQPTQEQPTPRQPTQRQPTQRQPTQRQPTQRQPTQRQPSAREHTAVLKASNLPAGAVRPTAASTNKRNTLRLAKTALPKPRPPRRKKSKAPAPERAFSSEQPQPEPQKQVKPPAQPQSSPLIQSAARPQAKPQPRVEPPIQTKPAIQAKSPPRAEPPIQTKPPTQIKPPAQSKANEDWGEDTVPLRMEHFLAASPKTSPESADSRADSLQIGGDAAASGAYSALSSRAPSTLTSDSTQDDKATAIADPARVGESTHHLISLSKPRPPLPTLSEPSAPVRRYPYAFLIAGGLVLIMLIGGMTFSMRGDSNAERGTARRGPQAAGPSQAELDEQEREDPNDEFEPGAEDSIDEDDDIEVTPVPVPSSAEPFPTQPGPALTGSLPTSKPAPADDPHTTPSSTASATASAPKNPEKLRLLAKAQANTATPDELRMLKGICMSERDRPCRNLAVQRLKEAQKASNTPP